jgi:hypothetical protein
MAKTINNEITCYSLEMCGRHIRAGQKSVSENILTQGYKGQIYSRLYLGVCISISSFMQCHLKIISSILPSPPTEGVATFVPHLFQFSWRNTAFAVQVITTYSLLYAPSILIRGNVKQPHETTSNKITLIVFELETHFKLPIPLNSPVDDACCCYIV